MQLQDMSTIKRDFIASHLRSQIDNLKDFLVSFEEHSAIDSDYINESLKSIEVKLRGIRKIFVEN